MGFFGLKKKNISLPLTWRPVPEVQTKYVLPPRADLYRKYGPLVKETVGGKTIVHVFDLGKDKEVSSLPS